ncbi:MAG: ABC-type transport auxiliary lipoprotein family protein [Pseudomonadota bacterium]
MMRLLALTLMAALAGCAGSDNAIEAIYTISADATPAAPSGTTSQLLVPEPRALASLGSNRIAVKPTPITLSYYPSVALEDTAPKVLQRVLLDTFQNTGRVRAVGLPGQSLLINFQVVTEIRAFQVETFGTNRARIEVSAKVLNDSNGRVRADRIFETEVAIPGDGPDQAAEGLNAAAQAISNDIVAWTLATI